MRKLSYWLDSYTPAESLDILKDLALSHALQGGAVGAEIASLIRRSDFRALCEYDIDYKYPWSVGHLTHCRQALAFFSKLEDLEIGIDKEVAAYGKFVSAEKLCHETNEIFSLWSQGKFSFSKRVDAVLFAAQRKIATVLGPVPKLDELRYRFGPGATTLTKKQDASSRRKLHDGIACSEDLVLGAPQLLREMPAWTDLHDSNSPNRMNYDSLGIVTNAVAEYFRDVATPSTPISGYQLLGVDVSPNSIPTLQSLEEAFEAVDVDLAIEGTPIEEKALDRAARVNVVLTDGKLGFVAKNAKTYRGIVTEPPLNGVYQLALGDYISKRLARFGVDLRNQEPNQLLAKQGSLTGDLATLDLSSASDTVAIELVYHLLPVDWALALSAGRSSVISYKGERICLEKFSSMGNGYTFALESLIFWALARSCSSHDDIVSVYGDDIIVATHNVDLLTEALTACGFILNKEKSFSQGPFRESCGADYYRGFDIRPFYQKNWLDGAGLYKLHNFYVRHGEHDRADCVREYMTSDWLLFGPDGYGDGHLLGEYPRERKPRHVSLGYSGYVFDTYRYGSRREKSRPVPGDYVYALYTIYQRDAEPIGVDAGMSLPVCDYARAFKTLRWLKYGSYVGAPIPEELWLGRSVKAASLPGTEGFKRISIYTLGM